jgi:hypothetical protein
MDSWLQVQLPSGDWIARFKGAVFWASSIWFASSMSVAGTELPFPNVRSSVANWLKRTRYAECEFFAF